MKTILDQEFEDLKTFMEQNVGPYSFIESWNNARERAKKVFSKEAISMLDGSGFIKKFKIRHIQNN